MRLFLLSLAAGLEILVGVGVMGPLPNAIPFWPLGRVLLAGMCLLAGGLLLADAFALGRSEARPYGFFSERWLKAGFVTAFALMLAALFIAATVDRKVLLVLSATALAMLAAGGALWRTDLWQALAWAVAHLGITLSGALLFPDFTYQILKAASWRPLGIAGLTALSCGLLGRALTIDSKGLLGALVGGMLVLPVAAGLWGAGRRDLIAVAAWLPVMFVLVEQTALAVSRRGRLGTWMVRRLSLLAPAGAGAAVLVGAGEPNRVWGGIVISLFAAYAVSVIVTVGPPPSADGSLFPKTPDGVYKPFGGS